MVFTDDNLPELALSLPKDCTKKLSAIISRHKRYMSAKAKGQLSTRNQELKDIAASSYILKEKGSICPLCLDHMDIGERVVKLPCGHIFHCGQLSRKRKRTRGCKGVLYWLANNSNCPQCRHDLPTELPAPTESEKLLLPLLHRQNRLIARQMEIIKAQKKQLEKLAASPKTSFENENPAKRMKSDLKSFKFPRMSWQDANCQLQKQTRKVVLERITNVTLKDIVVRGATNNENKIERLQELATKIEFILYCCSTSFQEYSDNITLRERTLNTVKNLADRARALKLHLTM